MEKVPFHKYHGLGNDFVVLDRFRCGGLITVAQAVALCDRHLGIGADGVLTILPPEPGADLRMHIFNADGSEAEMCGNGIRCVARHASDAKLVAGDTIRIATAGGLKRCELVRDGAGVVSGVIVEMGAPELDRTKIPVAGSGRMVRERVAVSDRTFEVTAVSMGNPHAVIFGEGLATLAVAKAYGPRLEENLELFPRKTNVEFATLRPDGAIDLVVWERGCGITQACGTGACATAVAAVVNGLVPGGKELTVLLPGGSLGITVGPALSSVRMRGPAVLAFVGTVEL